MKSGANVEIEVAWAVIGHSRSSAMSQFDRTHTTFYSTLKRNYASILYRFRDIASCLSKVADFNLPDLTYPFGDPAGGDPVECRKIVGNKKLESLSYRVALFV